MKIYEFEEPRTDRKGCYCAENKCMPAFRAIISRWLPKSKWLNKTAEYGDSEDG